MTDRMPSPCVDVCKFKRDGRCVACAMTEKEKKKFKKQKKESKRLALFQEVVAHQKTLGIHEAWRKTFARKAAKKGLTPPPLD